MRRRLTLAVLVTTLVSMLAAACGSSSSSDDKTIKVAYLGSVPAVGKLFKKVKPAFEKQHPGWNVQLTEINDSTGNEYYTKLSLMQRSPDTAPDVIYEDTFLINSDVQAGYLEPLDRYVKKWDDWDTYFDVAKKPVRAQDGHIYGIPIDTGSIGLWYNKELFKKAGLPVPWQPKNWAEVLTAARTLKKQLPGVIPLNVYSGTPAGEAAAMRGFEMLLYGTGDKLYNERTDTWVAPSQGITDSLEFIETIYEEGLAPKPRHALNPSIDDELAPQWLSEGKLAINLDGSWLPMMWAETGTDPWPQWSKTLGWAAMPTQHGQPPGVTNVSGGWALSVGSQSTNKDMAWEFVKLALSKENSLYFLKHSKTLAVREDVAKDPEYLKGRPDLKFWTDLISDTYYRPAYKHYPRISTEIQRAMETVMTGQASPQQATQRYTQAITGIVGPDRMTGG